VIRFRLIELLAEKSFKEGRRIEWQEVAEHSGIHKATLSRMLNVRGYNASMSNLDALCAYFACQVGDLAVHVPDEQLDVPVVKTYRGPKNSATRSARPVGSTAAAQRKK
jgi:putative transcriptional regulator